ncbi:MAG TPA: tripartite tricarboxylate transporter substrate binding protein [Xanthobacteraceae bacterium]|nr:tripartite tricarboxylate transporter substrate binding protein [Xanthobacteraceae bacterium]
MLRNLAFTIIAGLALSTTTQAADYPTRPVTLVVAFTPGGPSDVLARIVGKQLEHVLGQPFVIENRPGGAGNIAADYVARAKPDGYTLLMGNNSILATNGALFSRLGYNAEKDFAPISMVGNQPNILVVNPNVPAHSVAELIALARREPGKLNYGHSGLGTAAHLSAELFKSDAEVDIVGIAYKGAAPALQDVVAGQTQLMFATAASVIGHIKSGTVRPLAVTTRERFSLMPELPTIAATLPGFDATTWHGLVAPARTPSDIVETLHRATVAALADPETRKHLVDLGVEIAGDSPEEFAAYIRREIPKWTAVVKVSGARLD